MIENFNKIINNKSFEKVGSWPVIQRKNFLNEVIGSHHLMGLKFAHLTFLYCNFIDIYFRHTNFISCDFTNCNFTETIFLKSELDNCNFKNRKIFQFLRISITCVVFGFISLFDKLMSQPFEVFFC